MMESEKKPGSVFDLLPDETVLQIFGLLPLTDVIFRLTRTCRRFRDLGFDSVTEIHYEKDLHFLQGVEQAKKVVELFPKLRRFNLKKSRPEVALLSPGWDPETFLNIPESIDFAIHVLKSCPILEEFRGVRQDSSLFYDAVEEYGHSLRRLDFTSWGDLRAKALAHMTHLTISGPGVTCETLLKNLMELGECCKGLQSFVYYNCHGVWEGTREFLLNVKGHIKELGFDESVMSLEAYKTLSQCEQLEVLKLDSSYKLTVEKLKLILQLTNLREIYIRGPCEHLKEADYVAAFSGRKLTRLKKLTLSVGVNLSDVSLAAIAASCPELSHISINGFRDLDVWCRVSQISEAPVSNIGVRSLLENCRKLRVVELAGCENVTEEIFSEARRFLPDEKCLRVYRGCKVDVQWGPLTALSLFLD